MTKYAANTSVPVERSRSEIELILKRYGATSFAYFGEARGSVIQFTARGRSIRFVLPMPQKDHPDFCLTPTGKPRSEADQIKYWSQACRQRWRALLLAIKSKLETVECGITEFEQEFLAHIVDPVSGKTVGDAILPQIAENYGKNPKPLSLPFFEASNQ